MISRNFDSNQVRAVLLRMATIRWVLIGIAGITCVSAPVVLGIEARTVPILVMLGLLSAWNFWNQRRPTSSTRVTVWTMSEHLTIDLLALGGLLYFSGGATNPLVFLLLPPVAVAALTLPQTFVAYVAALAVISYSLLMVEFVPLTLAEPARASQLHLMGMWVTFVATVVSVSWLILLMSNALRLRSVELASVQEKAMRDEQIFALGALAAGAAHELSTPLATLAVLIDELEHSIPNDPHAAADLELMRSQIVFCKSVLSDLTEKAQAARASSAERMPCADWIQQVFSQWKERRATDDATLIVIDSEDQSPNMVAEPTLGQGLVNLFDNALRAGGPVTVTMAWDSDSISISVQDSGPGFSTEVLAKGGVEKFAASNHGSGLGLLLAGAAVTRVGGRLQLHNSARQGACVQLHIPIVKAPGNE